MYCATNFSGGSYLNPQTYSIANMNEIHINSKFIFPWIPVLLILSQTCIASNSASYSTEDEEVVQSSVQNGRAQYEMINRDAKMPRYIS